MFFRRIYLSSFAFFLSVIVKGQIDPLSLSRISKHINILASDSLKGRGNFTDELLSAANYISSEFAKANLLPLTGFFDYYVPFNAGINKTISRDKLEWNKQQFPKEDFFYFTIEKFPGKKSLNDFRLIEIQGKLSDSVLFQYWNETDNILIWWNEKKSKSTKKILSSLRIPDISPFSNVLIVVSNEKPETAEISTDTLYRENILFNIVGILPGKKKPSEIILFSAHYDHVGISNERKSDPVFNGANDNASGVSALIALADYYAAKKDNNRTIVFCAFAGEELGLLGSYDFAEFIKPAFIKSMINLEMLGINSTGKIGSFFITGEIYSDFKDILLKELPNTIVNISTGRSDNLFRRSDNFPFAKRGVPAHTIMSSDDSDYCYHKPCDESTRINVLNIDAVVRNIIKGCSKIISGEETPKRIKLK